MSDRILVQRSLDQDAEAFGELVRRHSPLMRAYVFRIVGSLAEADDVVQNACVVAWQQLATLRDASAVKAWMMRIASREASAHLRRRPQEDLLPEYGWNVRASDQPEAVAVRNAQLEALSQALNRLPDGQRRCWLLREVAGLGYQEIADELEVPAATVRGMLTRARASIMVQMEGWR